MAFVPLLAFGDVGLEVLTVAVVTFIVLTLALLSAAANVFFRSEMHFEDDVREATMDLSAADRRAFFERYRSRRPKSPAVAWFLAVGLGPLGVSLYRGRPYDFFAALLSLNGLGAWWIESWFSAPQLVLIENRELIAWTKEAMALEAARRIAPDLSELTAAKPPIAVALVTS